MNYSHNSLDNPMVRDEFVIRFASDTNECCMCGDELGEEKYEDKDGMNCKYCLLDKYLVSE
jgi:hypothetical protein